MNTMNFAEQMTAMQRMLLPHSTVSKALEANARGFWENQEKILNCMEMFAKGWFERRHAGTRAALEAAQCMCNAQTPIDFLREYQGWANGAAERMIADEMQRQRECMAIINACIPAAASKNIPATDASEAESEKAANRKAA